MTKPLIITDVDDVLVNCRKSIARCIKNEFGIDKGTSWTDYDLEKTFGISNDDIFKAFFKHNMLENAFPEPDAVKFVDDAKNYGFDVISLTARGWHPKGDMITLEIFERYGVDISEVIAIPPHHSKSDVMKELNNVFLFVDDHTRHVDDAMNSNVSEHVFIKTQSWNQNYERNNVKRVDSLQELGHWLKNQCS